VNAQVMKDTVLDLRSRGKTILFSTHIMEQAEKLCEQLCIIARGRKLVDGALSTSSEPMADTISSSGSTAALAEQRKCLQIKAS